MDNMNSENQGPLSRKFIHFHRTIFTFSSSRPPPQPTCITTILKRYHEIDILWCGTIGSSMQINVIVRPCDYMYNS